MRSVVLLLLITACSNSTGITEADISCDSTLTYDNFGESFVSEYCSSCHAGKQRPDLSSQSGIQANVDDILNEAVYTSDMPDGGSLTNEQRITLGQWLECGAP
ncbi:MAG: hypothetical protein QM831_29455 [Kofleriaceae bacterium]